MKLWYKASGEFPMDMLGEKTGFREKAENEKELDKIIDSILLKIKSINKSEEELVKLWKESLEGDVKNIAGRFSKLKNGEMDILFTKGIAEVTEAFIKRAREFDDKLTFEDIGQAMRNAWIMNILQILLRVPVELTPSVFGYSMLYPYTDNCLDDNTITKEEKLGISKWLGNRLTTVGASIDTPNESINATPGGLSTIDNLIQMIESQYPRQQYPGVYKNLLRIHSAQCGSLAQQGGASSPYEKDILGISVEKGGSSVLADGWLVKGELAPEEEKFIFEYGVLLQFCDDLQDAQEDCHEGHMTIFSQSIKAWKLDRLTNKLINFAAAVVDVDEYYNSEESLIIKKIIKENCLSLIMHAVSQNRKLFSRKYVRELEEYSLFSFKYYDKLKKKLKKEFKKLNRGGI